MTDFIVAAGQKHIVRELSWNRVKDMVRRQGAQAHTIDVLAADNPKRLVHGLQILAAECAAAAPLIPNDPVVVIHGDVNGEAGHCKPELLGEVQAWNLVNRLAVGNPALTPYHLDGGCSLCHIDAKAGSLRAYNDAVGFHRIFYYYDHDLAVVSTSLKALCLLLPRAWRLSHPGARSMLRCREPQWPYSIVDGIATLPPVHRLDADLVGIRITSYWQPAPCEPAASRDDAYAAIRDALSLSVRRHAQTERTVLFLSGGYDSTCLAKVGSDAGYPLGALSGGYAVHGYDETSYAESIANHFGLPFHKRHIEARDVASIAERLPDVLDQPGYDPTTYLLLSTEAKQRGYRAVLNGMGGDGLFAPKDPMHASQRMLPWLQFVGTAPPGRILLSQSAKFAHGRGPFRIVQSYLTGERARGAYALWSRMRFAAARDRITAFLGTPAVSEFDEHCTLREAPFVAAMSQAKSELEWQFYWAVWDNPDEYHAWHAIRCSALACVMPFATPRVCQTVFRHASRFALRSREIEADIVGGIPTHLLNPAKAGLAMPYEVVCRDMYIASLEAALSEATIDALGVNRPVLTEQLRLLKSRSRPQLDRWTSAFLWRFVMLLNYQHHMGLGV